MTDLSGTFPVDANMAANYRLLQDVDVKLTVEIGQTRLTLRELLDVFVNGTLIGRGEVVTVGERFGVRLTELVSPEKRG